MIKLKNPIARQQIADRILQADLNVLAVQEVEDIVTLHTFARDDLHICYPHVALVEGNDIPAGPA